MDRKESENPLSGIKEEMSDVLKRAYANDQSPKASKSPFAMLESRCKQLENVLRDLQNIHAEQCKTWAEWGDVIDSKFSDALQNGGD